MILRKGCR